MLCLAHGLLVQQDANEITGQKSEVSNHLSSISHWPEAHLVTITEYYWTIDLLIGEITQP